MILRDAMRSSHLMTRQQTFRVCPSESILCLVLRLNSWSSDWISTNDVDRLSRPWQKKKTTFETASFRFMSITLYASKHHMQRLHGRSSIMMVT